MWIGKIEKIGGVESYVATPSGEYDKTKAVLFLTDGFGIALNNNKVGLLSPLTPNVLTSDPAAC